MKKLKMLVLTDHQTHSQENSLYALLRELRKNPACAQVDVASRSTPANQLFFSQQMTRAALYASPVGSHFQYHPDGRCFREKLRRVFLREYDAIFLRLRRNPNLSLKTWYGTSMRAAWRMRFLW